MRFEREAQVLASLNLPGIVTVYSVEEQSGGGRGRPVTGILWTSFDPASADYHPPTSGARLV